MEKESEEELGNYEKSAFGKHNYFEKTVIKIEYDSDNDMNPTLNPNDLSSENGTSVIKIERDPDIYIKPELESIDDSNENYNADDHLASIPNHFCVNPTSVVKIEYEPDIKPTHQNTYNEYSIKEESANVQQLLVLCTRVVPLKCDHCEKIFVTLFSLNRHKISHRLPLECEFSLPDKHKSISIKPFKCDGCDKFFTSMYVMNRHKRVHEGLLTCYICQKLFPNKNLLDEHRATPGIHESLPKFQCDLCPFSTFFRQKLSKHRIKHSFTKPYKCDECGKLFARLEDMNHHHKRIHKGIFTCSICKKQFSSKSLIEEHRITPDVHKNIRKLHCDMCEFTTYRKSYLIRHLGKHSLNKPHKCDVCGKCFKCKASFNIHKSTHEGVFSCYICRKIFPSKILLEEHKAVPYIHEDKKEFCHLCPYIAFKKRDIVLHLSKHSLKKEFNCDVCGKSFKRQATLNRHKPIHELPFRCYICRKCFSTQMELDEHKPTHEKLHCTYCSFTSQIKESLHRHLKRCDVRRNLLSNTI